METLDPAVPSDQPAPGGPLPLQQSSSGSVGAYVASWLAKVRGGDTGVLPVVVGLLLIGGIFQSLNSHFLSTGNMVNLLVQGAVFMLLAMGEVFVLLLGEIDLSAGFVAGMGGIIVAELVSHKTGWPWWVAILIALLACAAIGALQGTIITLLGLPAFVVTLAGQLAWQGVMLIILGNGGTLPINDSVINNLANGNLSRIAGWVIAIGLAVAYAALIWRRDARRRSSGLVAPPTTVTFVKIAAVAVSLAVIVLTCNADRGVLAPITGVPWVVLIVLGVMLAWAGLLGRTKYGRYVYAIGGNAEAARRAGVNLALIRTIAFSLASMTAGIAGIIYASRLRSVSTNLEGGTLVLYAVAAAVIGGTSLLGGRGRIAHAALGGLVIAAIDNGMSLQGFSAASKYVVTGLVLLIAVVIDALARRGRASR